MIHRTLSVIVMIFILLAGNPSLGAAAGLQVPSEPVAPDQQDILFDRLRKEAFEAFYNLDYETSGKLFDQIAETFPEHSAGHLYLATQTWVTQLNRSRRLQTGIYASSSFYSKTREKLDPEIDQQFRQHLEKAIEKAEARLTDDEKDVEARYFLGAAYAVRAAYEASVAREFFAALKNGSRAVEEHRKVARLNPDFADAYLTIGIYDYIVGSLPMWVKVIAALGGIRGSKDRGIEELKRVVEMGKYAGNDARVLLTAIYAREGKYEKALEQVTYLADRYPGNYYLTIESANFRVKMGRTKEAVDAFETMLQSPRFAEVKDFIHFQYAQTLSANGYSTAALHHFRELTRLPEANPQLVALAYLRMGQVLDLQGDRQAAVAAYNTVLERENVFDSHEQAQRYLDKPYTGDGA